MIERARVARKRLVAEERILGNELGPTFGAIVIPSYGMSKWDSGDRYRLSFFSGVVTRAAFEMWRSLGAGKIIIEGARIFPNDPANDGDLMKDLLLRLGVPEETIIQRRNNTNTYNQLLDSRTALQELGIAQDEALYIYSDLHKQRIPKLMEAYRLDSDSILAENVLSDIHPRFAHAWDLIRSHPSYYKLMERPEEILTHALAIDTQGRLARLVSKLIFPFKGADVPDIRHREAVRSY